MGFGPLHFPVVTGESFFKQWWMFHSIARSQQSVPTAGTSCNLCSFLRKYFPTAGNAL